MTTGTKALCSCGEVEIDVSGAPITSVICYCDDCQEAGRRIEALPGARPVMEADGGTAFVVYRKDRVSCARGSPRLEAHKLRPDSPTSRVVARCCGAAMLLRFDGGRNWWTDVYRARLVGDAPPPRMCVCTKFRRGESVGPARDLPSYPGYPARVIVKLLGARLGMLF
jgi:hypothetical protein